MVRELIREKKPSDFEKWTDYIREKAKKYYWRDKMIAVIGEFPEICPHAIPEKLGELYDDGDKRESGAYTLNGKVWGECKCALYEDNKDMTNPCWYNYPPSKGRCDCFLVYWKCRLFRRWLKIKEINVVIK